MTQEEYCNTLGLKGKVGICKVDGIGKEPQA